MKDFIKYIFTLLCSLPIGGVGGGLLLSSCIEEYNAELPSSESNLLVVEGTIFSDSVSTFYLTLTMPVNSDEGIKNINDATIQLKGTDGTSVEGSRVSDGQYEINTPKLSADAQYSIVVKYNGDTYESDAQQPFPSVDIKSVEANQPSKASDVNILVTTGVPSDPSKIQYYRWTYKETWEVHPDVYSIWYWDDELKSPVQNDTLYPRRGWLSATSGDIIASSSAYYTNNQIVQYKLYDVGRSNRRLYELYSTDIMQRSLTKAEYEYETERKKISTEMGGLFTPQPSALPTNIHCTSGDKRALGYVGCSLNVQHYRLFVSPDTLNIDRNYDFISVTNSDDGYPGEEEMYQRGYVLYMFMDAPDITYYWTRPVSVDLRKMGCTTEKPSFWPN